MASKVFQDQIPPAGGRVYQLEQLSDPGKYHITDVTQYEQEGSAWSAEDANHVYDLAEGAVSQSTTVNGKPLSSDISLAATDVGLGKVVNKTLNMSLSGTTLTITYT